MERLSLWFRTSTPIMKMLMAISVTSAVMVVHRTLYAPHVRRQRYRRSEEWANKIIEQEESGEGGSNNIIY